MLKLTILNKPTLNMLQFYYFLLGKMILSNLLQFYTILSLFPYHKEILRIL